MYPHLVAKLLQCLQIGHVLLVLIVFELNLRFLFGLSSMSLFQNL